MGTVAWYRMAWKAHGLDRWPATIGVGSGDPGPSGLVPVVRWLVGGSLDRMVARIPGLGVRDSASMASGSRTNSLELLALGILGLCALAQRLWQGAGAHWLPVLEALTV